MKKLALFVLAAAITLAADLTGTWSVDVETDAGSGNPTLTLKQDGEKLTGKYVGMLGEHDLTGSVKGDEFQVSFKSEYGDVKYQGKLADGKIAGKVDLAGQATGTFKGSRKN